MPEMESLQGERSIFYAHLFKKQTNCPPGADQGFSTDSCNSRHALSPRGVHPATPPVPPFLLAQSLSSKRIAPTDNMQPKSDDAKSAIGG